MDPNTIGNLIGFAIAFGVAFWVYIDGLAIGSDDGWHNGGLQELAGSVK